MFRLIALMLQRRKPSATWPVDAVSNLELIEDLQSTGRPTMQVLILHSASTFAWTLPSLPHQWRRLHQSHVISWHIHNACIRQQAMCVELFEIEMETACRSRVRSRCFFFCTATTEWKKIERDLSLFFISHLLFCSIGIRMNCVCMFSEIFFHSLASRACFFLRMFD